MIAVLQFQQQQKYLNDMQDSTEYSKLVKYLNQYEKILHPDIFHPLLNQLNKAFDENKKEAFAKAKISDDALWLEEEIIKTKERINQHKEFPVLKSFHLKCFYKELINRFQVETH
jgi:hypothetical protein